MEPIKKTQCSRCFMDTSATDIRFSQAGVCNYCSDFERVLRLRGLEGNELGQADERLTALVGKIRRTGARQRYDCIVGLSGGLDSAWTLVKAVEKGLRVLAVHMDNGWNSELAQNNIEALVSKLGVDLYTHVIDWEEYRALMQAFFDANVIDVEILYDNAMLGVNYRLARRYGVKYILGGTNTVTEGMRMPPGWNWMKLDRKNILDIARRGGVRKFVTFPAISVKRYLWCRYVAHVTWIHWLDYFDYNKENAVDILVSDYGFKKYPYKHYESIFTRFYQGFILPEKFGVDKRKLHLSALLISGQLTRAEGLSLLAAPPYASQEALARDKQYFLKKMRWTENLLDDYLQRPGSEHCSFRSEKPLFDSLVGLYKGFASLKGRAVGAKRQ